MVQLVLVTDKYPASGESFVETEVKYLAKDFPKITVLPMNRLEAADSEIPSNVSVEFGLADSLAGSGKQQHLLSFTAPRSILRESIRQKSKSTSWKALLAIAQTWGKAQQAKQWFEQFLKPHKNSDEKVLLYTYWLDSTTLGAAMAANGMPNVTTVARAHRYDLYEEMSRHEFIPWRTSTLKQLDRVYLISDSGVRYLNHKYPAWSHKYTLAKLGTRDPRSLSNASDDGILRVVSCSHLVKVKRVHLLIEGLRAFSDLNPSQRVVWDHLGGGTLEQKLKQQASEQLPGSVRWKIHSNLTNEEVFAFYRDHKVDMFANVSESEGLPVAIMEALGCGIPVIATAVGGTPEAVTAANGTLLPKDCTASDIATALIQMQTRNIQETRLAARRSWQDNFDADTNYPAFSNELLALTRINT